VVVAVLTLVVQGTLGPEVLRSQAQDPTLVDLATEGLVDHPPHAAVPTRAVRGIAEPAALPNPSQAPTRVDPGMAEPADPQLAVAVASPIPAASRSRPTVPVLRGPVAVVAVTPAESPVLSAVQRREALPVDQEPPAAASRQWAVAQQATGR